MLPTFTTAGSGGSRSVAPSNDGVFANLAAKPERGEKNEDLPPVSLIMSIGICVHMRFGFVTNVFFGL
jgi:hypothetical protein